MRLGRGNVVVITGASAGVGRAVAVACGRRGCRVALLARGVEGLEGARTEVERAGGRSLAIATDVSDALAVERAADRVEAEFGPLSVWINCAMVTVFSPFTEMSAAEFRRVTEVTYLGYVHGTMAALRRMRARDHGTIIQIGSALAYRSIPLQSSYCGAKAAVRGFTDSLRSELIHDGSRVRLTMVQLPAVNTPQFDWARNRLPRRVQPVPPIYQPDAVADAILEAADRAPREMWVGRSSIQAILGTMVAPGLLDGMMARRAYGDQQTPEPADPSRPDNLDEAVGGDFGMHGRFGDRAAGRVLRVSSTLARGVLVSLAATTALGGIALARATARRRLRGS